MSKSKLYNLKQILAAVVWIITGSGSMVLLVAAAIKKNGDHCSGIEINISGVNDNFFIDKSDVQKIIDRYAGQNAIGKPAEKFNLRQIELALEKNIWIKNAELFFDNNNELRVSIEERQPIARIFTINGNTFYIDSTLLKIPVSEKFSARLPVFTNFPADATFFSKADSSLLNDIKAISLSIQKSEFLNAMIDQTDITAQRNFEMVPKIGNQLIVFGDGADVEHKFKKLELFYKNIMIKAGWQRYSVINLQYEGQVVAKIKGADDFVSDSLRTVQIMQLIAANAEKLSADSTQMFAQDSEKNTADSTLIQQSMERNEEAMGNGRQTIGDSPQSTDNSQQSSINSTQTVDRNEKQGTRNEKQIKSVIKKSNKH